MLFVNQFTIGLKIALTKTKRLCLNADGDDYNQTFLGETLSMAIIDSGCVNIVCGEAWLNCYLETLSDSEQK